MEFKSSLGRAGHGGSRPHVPPPQQVADGASSFGVIAMGDVPQGRARSPGLTDGAMPAGGKALGQRGVALGKGAAQAGARMDARALVQVVREALGAEARDWDRADAAFDAWAEPLLRRATPESKGPSRAPEWVDIDAASIEALFDELAGCAESAQKLVLAVLEAGLLRVRGSGDGGARLSGATAAAVMAGMGRLCLAGAEAGSAAAQGKPPGLAALGDDAIPVMALERWLRLGKALPELGAHGGAVATSFAEAASGLHPACMKQLFRVLGLVTLGHEPQSQGGSERVAALLQPLLVSADAVPLAVLHAAACGLAEQAVYSPEVALAYGGSGGAGDPPTPEALLGWGIERFVHAIAVAAPGVSPGRICAVAHAMALALDLAPIPSRGGGSERALDLAVTHALLAMPLIDAGQLAAFVAGLCLHIGLPGRDPQAMALVRDPVDDAFAPLRSVVGAEPVEVAQALARGFELALDPACVLGWTDLSPQAQWELLEAALVVPALEVANPSPGAQLQVIGRLVLPPAHAWMRTELALRAAHGRFLAVEAPAWSVVHQALLDRLDFEEGQVEAEVAARANVQAKAETKAGVKVQAPDASSDARQPVPSILPRWRVDDMIAFYEELEVHAGVTDLHRKHPAHIDPDEFARKETGWHEALDLFTLLRRDALRRYGDTRNPMFASLDRRLGTSQALLRRFLATDGIAGAGGPRDTPAGASAAKHH